MKPNMMRNSIGVALLLAALFCGCGTTPPEPGARRTAESAVAAQHVSILEGPVAVMPVVYRTLTYIPADLEKRKGEVDILAAVARPALARLLQAQGLEVIALSEMDSHIGKLLPEYWSEEGRAPEKLQRLAERAGAKTIVFFDVEVGYSYKRQTVGDYFSYQLAAPDIVAVWGYMEVYDSKGSPLRAFFGIAEIPAGTSVEALSGSLFCIGANWLVATSGVPLPPSQMKAMLTPGQVVPFPEISANRALYTEAKATEVLIGKMLAASLGKSQLSEPPERPLEIDRSLLRRSWHPLDVTEGPAPRITAPRGAKIQIVFASGQARQEKIVDLSSGGASKYSAFSGRWAKKMQQRTEKARSKYEAQLLGELTKAGTARGYTVLAPPGDAVWRSGLLQDTSCPMLMEKARASGSDVVILVTTRAPRDAKMTRFETWVKIIDARSGQFRKASFAVSPRQIARAVMNPLSITGGGR
ncbi:MAG: hypothetical protein JSU70_14855 [Phycisphaerales bacterium]|nr:MAG: hypothetical protein JSU70_14855 [Phycisphaerales bacterium]